MPSNGSLTQLVEYLPFKQRVTGSSPVRPTKCPHRLVVQDSGLSRRQQGFKPPWGRHEFPGRSCATARPPLSYPGPHRLAWSRTSAFHAVNRGSNPLGDARMQKAFREAEGFSAFEGETRGAQSATNCFTRHSSSGWRPSLIFPQKKQKGLYQITSPYAS